MLLNLTCWAFKIILLTNNWTQFATIWSIIFCRFSVSIFLPDWLWAQIYQTETWGKRRQSFLLLWIYKKTVLLHQTAQTSFTTLKTKQSSRTVARPDFTVYKCLCAQTPLMNTIYSAEICLLNRKVCASVWRRTSKLSSSVAILFGLRGTFVMHLKRAPAGDVSALYTLRALKGAVLPSVSSVY